MDKYKVDDFEAVQELEPVNGCDVCWFYQVGFMDNKRCAVVTSPVGQELEEKFGECEEGHHYKLIEKQ
jgi:hypothetical protein